MNVEDRAAPTADTFDALSALDAVEPLGAGDLEALGEAAWWIGRVPECIAARERSVAAYVADGRPRQAALVVLRLFYTFSVRGDSSIASGWLRRARRLLDSEPEGVEHGQLCLAEARVARARGDADVELSHARRAIALGERFADADLVALGQYIEGRLLVRPRARRARGRSASRRAYVASPRMGTLADGGLSVRDGRDPPRPRTRMPRGRRRRRSGARPQLIAGRVRAARRDRGVGAHRGAPRGSTFGRRTDLP